MKERQKIAKTETMKPEVKGIPRKTDVLRSKASTNGLKPSIQGTDTPAFQE